MQVDENKDGNVSMQEFFSIFKKAAGGDLENEGLQAIAGSVDVSEVGVSGAKDFFEAKIKRNSITSSHEEEIKAK